MNAGILLYFTENSLAYLCCSSQSYFTLGVVRKKVNLGQQSVEPSVRGLEIPFHHTGWGIIAVSSRYFGTH